MPMYEYQCRTCKTVQELLRSMHDRNESPVCTKCGSTDLEKLLSAHNVGAIGKDKVGSLGCGMEGTCSRGAPACASNCCGKA